MKVILFIAGLFIGLGIGYMLTMKLSANPEIAGQTIDSKVIPRAETTRESGNWGVLDKYTYDNASTYGTENMFTAVVDLLPGESVHPTHRHAEEEFLYITKGTGVWSLEGKDFAANTGDLLYASPWNWHGVVNTGTDTMSFFFLKWGNKGIAAPAEPEGEHIQ